MAATIDVIKTYGNSGTPTEVVVTAPGLLSTDNDAAPAVSPVTVPGEGTSYSYECWLRFKCTVAPDNVCENFKIWSSGVAVGTGLVITVNSTAVDTYVTPVTTLSAAGTRVDFATKNSAAKVSVVGSLDAEDEKSDFFVFQLEVLPATAPGNKSYTCNYSYDES